MQNVLPFTDKRFPIGFNDTVPPEETPTGFCVTAQNCLLDNRKIIERNGYSLAGNDTNENNSILGLGYLESGSTKHMLKVNNDSSGGYGYIEYWTGTGSWTWISTRTLAPNLDVEMETAKKATYITNMSDTVLKWDGTTLTQIATFPKAAYIKWFHNFMFAFKTAANKSRLYFSNLGDPETWGAADFIDIEPDDGDEGTGLAVLGDELIISKLNYLKSFSGWTVASFTVSNVNEKLNGYGAISHRSFVNIGNDLIFLSYAGDIPHFRSLKRTQFAENIYGGIISEDIEVTMSGLSKSYLRKTVGVYDGRNVRMFVPNGSSTYNDLGLFYNVNTKGWTKHTGIYASCAEITPISGAPVIYFGEARAYSRVYKFDSSLTDNGDSIDFKFETRRFAAQRFLKVKWKYLNLEAEGVGNVNVGVAVSVDGFSYDTLETFNLMSAGTTFPIMFSSSMGEASLKRKSYNLGYPPKYSIQLRLTKKDALARATVRDYEFQGYPRNRRSV